MWHRRLLYPWGYGHGSQPLLPPEGTIPALRPLCPGPGPAVGWRDLLFIDTETTGLGHGTGTLAFLIGVARFRPVGLEINHLFLRAYHEESPLLLVLANWLRGTSAICTFNGRTFDLPLLKTRFTMNRLPFPACELVHLDLLPVARRFWGERVGNCSLTSLESAILGFRRQNDILGSEIPSIYFEYQRSGDPCHLPAIVDHNTNDLLSLVGLAYRLATIFSPTRPDGQSPAGDELVGLGKLLYDNSQPTGAIAPLETALSHDLPPNLRSRARHLLSLAYRQEGNLSQASALWELMAAEGSPFALIELAKYLEHHRRDYRTALDLVELAMAMARQASCAGGQAYAPASLEHRLRRLRRKLGR